MHISQLVMTVAAMAPMVQGDRIEHPQRDVPAAERADCQLAGLAAGEDVRVYLNHNATVATRFSLDGGATAASTISIAADVAGPRFVLVVASAQDMIWDFRGFPAQRLIAVVTLGPRRHAVANLPATVPVRFSMPEGAGSGCLDLMIFKRMDDAAVKAEVGLKMAGARVVDDPDSAAINVDGGRPRRPDPDGLALDAIRANGPVTRDSVAPGIRGMIDLLASGAIRNATQADTDAWLAAHDRAGLPKRGFGPANTYVLLRATDLPRDVVGFRPNFIVPAGVPVPKGRH